MKLHAVLLLLLSACAGCGNYSNEDVDFQLAVPVSDELEVQMPRQQALLSANAAEYLVRTYEVVGSFNKLIDDVTNVIDTLRALAPTSRQGDTRIWGPFPAEKDPSFELRLVITRGREAAGGFRFVYAIEFHRVGAATPFLPLLTGTFAPTGGAGRGSGQFALTLAGARLAQFPTAEWGALETLLVRYQRTSYPHTVEMVIENVRNNETPGATVTYSEEQSGAGAMSFAIRLRDNALVQALGIKTRWRPDGMGRGDARVLEGAGAIGGLLGPLGTDCWGPDGSPTYSMRNFAPERKDGDPATCVFPVAP